MSFADLDADGAAELIAATQTQLHAFESGSNVATVSARVYESPSVSAMVAGDFAPAPGQDLALLVDDTLLVHPADGVAGFDAPSASEAPPLDCTGMLAGDFDGVAPTDLLIWGEYGTQALAGTDFILFANSTPIVSAAAHDLSSGGGRFVLRNASSLWFFSLDGMPLAEAPIDSGSAAFVTAFATPQPLDLDATVYATWTLIQLMGLDRWMGLAQPIGQWSMSERVSAMASGDLDGDSSDEILLIHNAGVTLIDNFENGTECTMALDLGGLAGATHLALGDWDGDADDELAIALADGGLVVFDGEG